MKQTKRYLLAAVLITTAISNVSAQTHKVDSLRHVLHISGNDTTKTDILNALCVLYQNNNQPEKAIDCGDSALLYAEHSNYTTGQAAALLHIGNILTAHAAFNEGLNDLFKALLLYKDLDDNDSLLVTYNAIATAYDNAGDYTEALHFAMKALRLEKDLKNKNAITAAYNTVATIYCNLGEYARALRFYARSLKTQERISDNNDMALKPFAPPIKRTTLILDSNLQALQTHEQDTLLANTKLPDTVKHRIHIPRFKSAFDDGKEAICYGIILHVLQPVPTTRGHIMLLSNVGHTFITLIKYNKDGSTVTRSVGFYPVKNKILRATPFAPSATPKLLDDSKHAWTESVGKIITEEQFNKVLHLVKQYKRRRYNLSTNNCTDFGLKAAFIAGIEVYNTYGKWPGGSGNNPGDAGESILEEQVRNTDTGSKKGLFINNTPAKRILLKRSTYKLKKHKLKLKLFEVPIKG